MLFIMKSNITVNDYQTTCISSISLFIYHTSSYGQKIYFIRSRVKGLQVCRFMRQLVEQQLSDILFHLNKIVLCLLEDGKLHDFIYQLVLCCGGRFQIVPLLFKTSCLAKLNVPKPYVETASNHVSEDMLPFQFHLR